MPFELIPSPQFLKEAKVLAKKHASLREDLVALGLELVANPTLGEPLGKDCYKVRVAITSKGKGKSGGARVITCVKIVQERIFLLAIYDKSEMENIDDGILKERLKFVKK
jgi:mRNA-degrading endonuclease RelE of RelBE toxin-antitoxin system